MNKLAIISAFLGGVRNRYMQYHPDRTLKEKFDLAGKTEGISGFELCYPADFEDISVLTSLLSDHGFGVSSINVRSRRAGKWLRGAFSSAKPQERQEVVDDFKRALDIASEIGSPRISTCPLNDGHDYVFEMDYFDAYRYAEETFAAICSHNPSIRVCIEYKWNDPRTRCLFGSAGETLSFCQSVGAENLGVTMDIGHSIQTGERPAQSVALLQRAGRLFYVHLNDNDRNWDWDMLPGAYNFWDFIEFFHYLKLAGYEDDWYAFDVLSKEVDPVEHFQATVRLTRRLEELANRVDDKQVKELAGRRNPAEIMSYLYETVIR
jgi:xylose isomerase